MRIKLTKDLSQFSDDSCQVGKEFDAIYVAPRSTTVEFETDSGSRFRAFHYEYELVETAGDESTIS
ncbi:MAG: hypothetical protein HRT37_05710 [Alteromonadaceae bacterium]|nr:hypothetical protein [Alteromonadaceae bacterium]